MAGIIIPKRSHIDLMNCNFQQYVRGRAIYIALQERAAAVVCIPDCIAIKMLLITRTIESVIRDIGKNAVYMKSDFLRA